MSQWYDKTAAQTLAGLESGRSGLSPQEAQEQLDAARRWKEKK